MVSVPAAMIVRDVMPNITELSVAKRALLEKYLQDELPLRSHLSQVSMLEQWGC